MSAYSAYTVQAATLVPVALGVACRRRSGATVQHHALQETGISRRDQGARCELLVNIDVECLRVCVQTKGKLIWSVHVFERPLP